jgi:hypothetical protein
VAERRQRVQPFAEDPSSFGRRLLTSRPAPPQLPTTPLAADKAAGAAANGPCYASELSTAGSESGYSFEDSASERSRGGACPLSRPSSMRRLGAMMFASGEGCCCCCTMIVTALHVFSCILVILRGLSVQRHLRVWPPLCCLHNTSAGCTVLHTPACLPAVPESEEIPLPLLPLFRCGHCHRPHSQHLFAQRCSWQRHSPPQQQAPRQLFAPRQAAWWAQSRRQSSPLWQWRQPEQAPSWGASPSPRSARSAFGYLS